LGTIGQRRRLRLVGLRLEGKRRRPSGEKPPLPRELSAATWFWIITTVVLIGLWISLFAFPATADWWELRDNELLRWVEDLRNDTATGIAKAIHALGSQWFIRPLRWVAILALIYYKRWRHLFAFAGSLLLVATVVNALSIAIARPRPLVEIIAPWIGYSHPSRPVAGLALTLGLIGMTLVPRGRWRNRWFTITEAIVLVLIIARVYLGVDHLSDGVVSALFGFGVAVIVIRLFVPESAFPVTFQRGVTAHLDVGGARGAAIRRALQEQLGVEIQSLEPFGLAGSGGSTPLRLTCCPAEPDHAPVELFAKLYSRTHLRSDRWYKVGRTILYGTLEDEVRFSSVRRLVQYEDYILLRMREAGLPSPEPVGIAEITPESEYLLVTEFLHGAEEISEAGVDDAVIDQALLIVRRMWDAGLAHRDLKPANVMVQNGEVKLIDVAFATIGPSPWRQAVDLANMMIILGLRCDPAHVYERALGFFAPDDIAEAFAATRGITIPSESRAALKSHNRDRNADLVETFRSLAPPREPVAIQRWSPRRIGLALGALFLLLFAISTVLDNLTGAGFV
jgi:membrane-associated phospholipid phosphatase